MSGGAFLASAFNPFAFLTESITSTGRPFFISEHPRFVWNGGDLTLSLPTTALIYGLPTVGGDIEADSGYRAGYIVRRDEVISFSLRFRESEWTDVQNFITAVQAGISFTWYPIAEDTATFFRVQLESPMPGASYRATPDANYPRVQLLPISVVSASFVPGPAPQPEPPDFSATPWAFWRRGVGRFQDDSAIFPTTGDHDRVAIWQDQIGSRDMHQDGGLFHNVAARPEVIGSAIRFGIIDPPQSTFLDGPLLFGQFAQGEYMISLRAEEYPGGGSSGSGLMANGSAVLYANSDGHLYGGFGLPSSADLGVPPQDITQWRVFGEAAGSVDAGYTARFNNTVIKHFDNDEIPPVGFSGFSLGAVSGYGFWKGQVRDLVIFNYILTTSQRLAWYNYTRGETDTPPYFP